MNVVQARFIFVIKGIIALPQATALGQSGETEAMCTSTERKVLFPSFLNVSTPSNLEFVSYGILCVEWQTSWFGDGLQVQSKRDLSNSTHRWAMSRTTSQRLG
jgi:hypothetical protein